MINARRALEKQIATNYIGVRDNLDTARNDTAYRCHIACIDCT